ncbi:hypothetical protein C7M84_024363 [Penaeus vannamei]|uniref:Uncharacterized protein n=1 Tax=Penaeus vannamei TaxID=6689 RepID=A0A3R7PTW5_PENVA|nr:hypothetical protein C7M84_024363 [Penaeus vannamei]
MTTVTKPPPRHPIPDIDVGVGSRPCDDEEDCYNGGSGSGEFNTDDGVLTDVENGDDVELENPATNQPLLQPEIIHSEESLRPSGKKDPGSGPTTTRSFYGVPVNYGDIGGGTEYDDYTGPFGENPIHPVDPTKVRTPNTKGQIHSDAGGATGRKGDETKNYEGIPTVPTPMVNGQGNGNIKPGDRRPVKKQSKDVKEWYV